MMSVNLQLCCVYLILTIAWLLKVYRVHTLHCVKSVGSQPLETFKDVLTEDEFRRCQSNTQLGKTWFKMTTDVFISYLFRVRFMMHL
jgi:hypothetical protein